MVWILLVNWGQFDIIVSCYMNKYKTRLQKKIDHKGVAWINKNLRGRTHRAIVLFLPITKADTALSERFSLYRELCMIKGLEEKRRPLGNLPLST